MRVRELAWGACGERGGTPYGSVMNQIKISKHL
jgi:hypothetical protein